MIFSKGIGNHHIKEFIIKDSKGNIKKPVKIIRNGSEIRLKKTNLYKWDLELEKIDKKNL